MNKGKSKYMVYFLYHLFANLLFWCYLFLVSDTRDPNKALIMPISDGAIKRNRGCWNCRSWDNQEKAIQFWQSRRQTDLNYALALSKVDPLKEEAIQVVNIRRMVNLIDNSIAQGVFGLCLAGKGGADLVHNVYLCDSWSGKEGSSLATSGTRPDMLPEELKERREEDVEKGTDSLINIKLKK